jgi:hypothetical protein
VSYRSDEAETVALKFFVIEEKLIREGQRQDSREVFLEKYFHILIMKKLIVGLKCSLKYIQNWNKFLAN